MRTASRLAILLTAILFVTLAPVAGQEGKTPREVTLANLQTALNGEFTARARYRAFADKATEEGYGQVASLFHACARGEEIHAGRFMSLIQARGGEGMAVMEPFEVKSTRENLQTAWAWEKKERDQLYPAFAEAALAAGDKRAAEAFDLVRNAENEHAKLCQEALNKLDDLKGSEPTSYWVCKGCGYVTPAYTGGACRFCKGPATGMVEIR
jgi:rubrerythrin